MPEVRIYGQKVSSLKRIVAIRWTSVLSADRMRPLRCGDPITRAGESALRSHQVPRSLRSWQGAVRRVQGDDESAQRQHPCRCEAAGTNGNADRRTAKKVAQGDNQVDTADQGQRWHDAGGEPVDSRSGPDRQRGK